MVGLWVKHSVLHSATETLILQCACITGFMALEFSSSWDLQDRKANHPNVSGQGAKRCKGPGVETHLSVTFGEKSRALTAVR